MYRHIGQGLSTGIFDTRHEIGFAKPFNPLFRLPSGIL